MTRNWYNLEKSKRVEAVCPCDYDKCIRNALLSASQITKAGFKYVCLDDAILQGLQFESAHESNCCHQVCLWKEELTGKVAGSSHSVKGLSISMISFEPSDHIESNEGCFMQKKKRKVLDDSEDDSIEESKRMRDLEDIGIKLVPTAKSDGLPDVAIHVGSNIHSTFSIGSPVNSSKSSPLPTRRKHSQDHTHMGDSIKRKRRRRPIRKVLESTAKMDPHAFPNQDIKEVKVCGFDSLESKMYLVGNISYNSESNRSSCERDILSLNDYIYTDKFEIDVTVLQDTDDINVFGKSYRQSTGMSFSRANSAEGTHRKFVSGATSESSQVGSMQSNKKSCDGICSVGNASTHHAGEGEDQYSRNLQVGQKMNVEQLTMDENFEEVNYEPNPCLKKGNSSFSDSIQSDGCDHHRSRVQHPKKQASSMLSSKEESSLIKGMASQFGTFEESLVTTYLLPMQKCLYDVPLNVQATYKGQHVPLVSVTSKLNGKAIVGHPITVEVSTKGFCNILEAYMPFRPACSGAEIYDVRPKSFRTLNSGRVGAQLKTEAVDTDHFSFAMRKNTSRFGKCRLPSGNARKLPSIAVGHAEGKVEKTTSEEKASSPFITCVPIKKVFRRINEGLS